MENKKRELKITRAYYLPYSLVKEIERMAAAEKRTASNLVSVLLTRAIEKKAS